MLAIVILAGLGIAALTVWAYVGHRQASVGRLILLTALLSGLLPDRVPAKGEVFPLEFPAGE